MNSGSRLGPYEIVAPIGAGGMGEVYKARDLRLNRFVAIKVLPPDTFADDDRNQRFLQEARAASALNHPNIVSVFDIGSEAGATYLVMELVDGSSLDTLIPQNGFRVPELLRIASQIANACSSAHAAGIVHRDLKPSNVMLTAAGVAKVLDFGLAKLIDEPGPANDHTLTQAAVTQAGIVMGTPAYMSPEQAEGKTVDARSDIFSFGAVLYELATGRKAFPGTSTAAILAAVLQNEPQPLAELRPDLPVELARLITRCLRKEPARRAQSMADLRVIFDELRDDADAGRLSGPVQAIPPVPRRSRLLLSAGAALVIALGAFVLMRMPSQPASPATPMQAVTLTDYPGNESSPSFSPDGSQVAFSWSGEDNTNRDIYVKLIGSGAPLRLTNSPLFDDTPQWSPDGKQIAFLRFQNAQTVSVMLVPPLGGTERKLTDFHTSRMPSGTFASLCWTPDSRFLIVSGNPVSSPVEGNSLQLLSVESGDSTPILTAKPPASYSDPAVSPDGKTLALLSTAGSSVPYTVGLTPDWKLSGTPIERAVGESVSGLAWTADSQSLILSLSASRSTSMTRLALSGGPPEPLVWAASGSNAPAVSARGDRLAFTRNTRDTNIWRLPLDTQTSETMRKMASSSFRDVNARYSPNGLRVAYHSDRGGGNEVWTAAADGSGAVQLTGIGARLEGASPQWSPDSRQIVFDARSTGVYHIYVIDAEGGRPRALTSGTSGNFSATWSPDGKWIYFTSTRTGSAQLWRVPPAGGNAEQVTRNGGESPGFSPDGKSLFFVKDSGNGGLWRMPIEGGTESKVADSVYRGNFALDQHGVFYTGRVPGDPVPKIFYLDLRSGKSREVYTYDKTVDLGLSVSADGRYLLLSKVDYFGSDLMLVDGFR